MNKSLRQLFTAVIVLFVILGISSSLITTVKAESLAADPRNRRSYYKEFASWRGSIVTQDGTVLAESVPSHDLFSYQRIYHEGEVFAPVTGFFSISQGTDRGLESSHNTLLNGSSNSLFWQHIRDLTHGKPSRGVTVETSINPRLQRVAYEALKNYNGAAVAIEPSTGRILAMVSTPSYDPNLLALHNVAQVNANYTKILQEPGNPMLNKALHETYPPGSTFKTIVAAAALKTGNFNPDTIIPAGAGFKLPNSSHVLTNAISAGNGRNGKISFADALAYSSNTAFAQLGISLGEDAIRQQAELFGFNTRITVDQTNTKDRKIRSALSRLPRDLSEDALALSSIGQGNLTISPLQNALIAAGIANGGKLMTPTLVDTVRSSDLSVISSTTPRVMSEVMTPAQAAALTSMMEGVITKDVPRLRIPGVKWAAKTGTAQIGEHNESLDGWLIGFAPADHPRIAVAVVLHNVNLLASLTAGPIARTIIQEALKP